MATKFLLVPSANPRMNEGSKDGRIQWPALLKELLDKAEVDHSDYRAGCLIAQNGSGWAVSTSPKTTSDPTGFCTRSFDCGGFNREGLFILQYDVPDAIVLINDADVDEFVNICASAEIEVVQLQTAGA